MNFRNAVAGVALRASSRFEPECATSWDVVLLWSLMPLCPETPSACCYSHLCPGMSLDAFTCMNYPQNIRFPGMAAEAGCRCWSTQGSSRSMTSHQERGRPTDKAIGNKLLSHLLGKCGLERICHRHAAPAAHTKSTMSMIFALEKFQHKQLPWACCMSTGCEGPLKTHST